MPAPEFKANDDPGSDTPADRAQIGPAALPPTLVEGIASMSGHDLSGVQVHVNSSQPASVGALAYTQGSEIHIAPGQDHHLPHDPQHDVKDRH